MTMATTRLLARIEQFNETEAEWLISDPILLNGEFAVVKFGNTKKIKIGDGIKKFSQTPYTVFETGDTIDGITPATPAVTPTAPVSFIAETGVYPNFGGVEVTGAAGYIVWNGTAWKAINVNIALTEYAKTSEIISVIDQTANESATFGKEFNYLKNGNSEPGFFTRMPGSTTYSFQNPTSSVLPLGVIKKTLKIHSTAGSDSFVGQSVQVLVSDRVIVGAWFNKLIFQTSGVNGIGLYAQALNVSGGVTESGSQILNLSQLLAGSEYIAGNYKIKVVDLSGDWVYLSQENIGDFSAGTTSIVFNLYLGATATTASFDFYVGNITMLKGKNLINPYLVYDNSAFTEDILTPKIMERPTTVESQAIAVSAAADQTIVNALNRGNEVSDFWRKPIPDATELTITSDIPGFLQGKGKSLLIEFASLPGTSGLITRDVPVVRTERVSGGMWVRISDVISSGATAFGYYIQGAHRVADDSPTFGTPLMLSVSELQQVGFKITTAVLETEVHAVESGWSFIGFKQTADFPVGTTFLMVNIFADGLSGGSGSFLTAGHTFIKSDSIKPYANYNNAGLSKINGVRITVDGTSIIEYGFIQRALESLTGCITDFSMALSGSGYTTNPILAQPPMIDSSRTDAIKNSNPEIIILEGGVNDGRVSAPLGYYTIDAAFDNPDQPIGTIKQYQHPFTSEQRYYLEKNETDGTANYLHFYPAVYRRLKVVSTDNPIVPIVVLTPMPSFYFADQPDTDPTKDNPNKPNLNGHFQIDYSHAIIDVAEMMGIPCLDMYANSGINRYTYKDRLDDGIHPTTEKTGMMIAKMWLGFLETIV